MGMTIGLVDHLKSSPFILNFETARAEAVVPSGAPAHRRPALDR